MSVRNRLTSRIARWTHLPRRSLSYYDFVLLAVPTVLLTGLVATAALSIPSYVGVTTAGIVSAFVLADAMFNRPPSGRSV